MTTASTKTPAAVISGDALKAIATVVALLVMALLLYLWAGASEQRVNEKLNAPIVRAQKLAATPGYNEGHQLGYEVGLAGAGNPTNQALVQIGRIHAEKHGHKDDDKWVDTFGIGYREGLIAAYDKKDKDAARWK